MVSGETSTKSVRELAETYFGATARRDLEGMLACWAPDGVESIPGVGELNGRDEIRGYFTGLFSACPDFTYQTLNMIVEGEYAAVHWKAGGHFTGTPLQGFVANGSFVELEGIDLIRFEDGLIRRNDVAFDTMEMLISAGFLPKRGSLGERAFQGAQNLLTRAKRAFAGRG